MAMPVTLRRFTVDDLHRFPDDGNRYELLDGVLFVTPGPELPHQLVTARLTALLLDFLRAEAGAIVTSPGTVVVRPRHQLEPDVLVSLRPPQARTWEEVTEHWLAVEVWSPSTWAYDQEYKRDAYLDLGVREVWLIDPKRRLVLVSGEGAGKDLACDIELRWQSPGSGRKLRVDLEEVFAEIPEDW